MVTNNEINIPLTVSIANGGTNATSFATTNGIVFYSSPRLITSTNAVIDASNIYTNTGQTAASGYQLNDSANVTGDGTSVSFDCTEAIIDVNSSMGTDRFDPTPLKICYVNAKVTFINLDASHTTGFIKMFGLAAGHFSRTINVGALRDASNRYTMEISTIYYSGTVAGQDQLILTCSVSNGTKTVGIAGGTATTLMGWVVC